MPLRASFTCLLQHTRCMCTCMHHRFPCRTDGMNNPTDVLENSTVKKKYFNSLFNLVSVLTPTYSPIFFFFQQFDDFPRPIIAHICKGGCIISLWSERCLSFRSAAFFEFQSCERRHYWMLINTETIYGLYAEPQ